MIVKISLVFFVLCGIALGQRSSSQPRFGTSQAKQFQSTPLRTSPPAPRQTGPFVELLRSNRDGPNEDGSYSFDFATSDGATREEQGRLSGAESYVITGSYSYTAPDGTLVEVTYVADENGYRAESPLIPAIPPHSLEQIRAAQNPSSVRPRPQTQQQPRAQTPRPQPRQPQPPRPQPPRPQPRQPQPPRPQPPRPQSQRTSGSRTPSRNFGK